jgi:chromosome segregation ATPase
MKTAQKISLSLSHYQQLDSAISSAVSEHRRLERDLAAIVKEIADVCLIYESEKYKYSRLWESAKQGTDKRRKYRAILSLLNRHTEHIEALEARAKKLSNSVTVAQDAANKVYTVFYKDED